MPLSIPFDFKKPDYLKVFSWRMDRLKAIRQDPGLLQYLKLYYKHNPAQFIIDWGCTFDPRNVEIGLPAVIPFILFPKQEEYVHWFMERWQTRTPGVVVKSRDVGMSWLSVALSCTICLFYDAVVAGFGSRKEEYVDRLGDPKALLYKARQFIQMLPVDFRNGWDIKKHSAYMRISFPITNSLITGEAGDNIGRGDRKSFFNVDESAHLQHPDLVDASLSQTTNCRIDLSTPFGSANSFARKCTSGKISKFVIHWRDDPRKDEAWYNQKCLEIDDPVIIAQELDLDFSASIEGVIIPSAWVQAAIDAHIKLNIVPHGTRKAAFDVADQGKDANAMAGRYGFLVENLKVWSGSGSDIYISTEKAFNFCDEFNYSTLIFDEDGLGAGVRADARVINEKRRSKIVALPFRGSSEVFDPDKEVFTPTHGTTPEKGKGVTNIDYFENFKAQSWWSLRKRFYKTYRAVTQGQVVSPDEIISLDSKLDGLSKLIIELSQPTFETSKNGKMMVNKIPEGARSPNCADAVMMVFAEEKKRPRGMFDFE